MKITGSLVNSVMAESTAPTPVVGMGATVLLWSDRHAATVEWVSPSGKTLRVREDTATLVGGSTLSESQRYTITPNPTGREWTFRLGPRGWTSRGTRLHLGSRDEYRDPTF